MARISTWVLLLSLLSLAAMAAQAPEPSSVLAVVNGRAIYVGRIDDRYVDLGLERPAPTTHDLADALTAALAGKPIARATTQAVGCFIADFAR